MSGLLSFLVIVLNKHVFVIYNTASYIQRSLFLIFDLTTANENFLLLRNTRYVN